MLTATGRPHRSSMAVSFSASPTPTQLRGESSSSASAAATPDAFVTPAGSTITAPLLKVICSSSPSSRIARSTRPSLGSQEATTTRPTENGSTPSSRSRAAKRSGGGSASGRSSRVAGLNSRAPFSATTKSNRSRRGMQRRRSGSSRSVTRISLRAPARSRSSAVTVGSSTAPSRAMVPS